MSDILVNKLITPDGTVLISRSGHDYKEHRDKNGELYVIDGGTTYSRFSVNKEKGTRFLLTTETDHEILRSHFGWGSYGMNADQPLRYILLKDMEEDHIKNVLKNCILPDKIINLMKNELSYRGVT